MNRTKAEIRSNRKIAKDTWEMVLETAAEEADAMKAIRPGQFVDLKLEGFYLRRPISICDWDESEGTITIIYKTVGRGTEAMSGMEAGESLDMLWPLGNGYSLPQAGTSLLIGGGAGVPPMYGLCRKLAEGGETPVVILGFRSTEDIICRSGFEELGARVYVATEDGSTGCKGFVTDVMKELLGEGETFDRIFACGPEAMLRAVDQAAPEEIPGWFSFEERMGCGFGACMGCSCETKYGSKRICKDGPVLERSEILW